MIGRQPIDTYARRISDTKQSAVASSAATGAKKRTKILQDDYGDPDPLRRIAGRIKKHTLHHLDRYLEQAEAALKKHGAHVHFATAGDEAKQTILSILRSHKADRLTKTKSMAAEEIRLNPFLEQNGIECLESDLGEFIVQLDDDEPSHIVKPIIHKNRREIAETFVREGIAEDYNDDPETITRRARAFLRRKYLDAQACITGANFVSAESGRVVLVTNEGNSRFGMAPVPLHIVLVGIEKLVPTDRDLGVLLNLLARSATAKKLTVHTEFTNGPLREGRASGPEHMHVVFMDNGRSSILGSEYRDILRCIRCAACQNVCPVYRQASGHAYRSPYGGPVGSVLSPLLFAERFAEYADLPKACSLCGACDRVCPVSIPLSDLLVRLRDKAKRAHVFSPGTPPLGGFAILASSPLLWRTAIKAAPLGNHIPVESIPVRPLSDWTDTRTLPEFRGDAFRKWLATRDRNAKPGKNR